MGYNLACCAGRLPSICGSRSWCLSLRSSAEIKWGIRTPPLWVNCAFILWLNQEGGKVLLSSTRINALISMTTLTLYCDDASFARLQYDIRRILTFNTIFNTRNYGTRVDEVSLQCNLPSLLPGHFAIFHDQYSAVIGVNVLHYRNTLIAQEKKFWPPSILQVRSRR